MLVKSPIRLARQKPAPGAFRTACRPREFPGHSECKPRDLDRSASAVNSIARINGMLDGKRVLVIVVATFWVPDSHT